MSDLIDLLETTFFQSGLRAGLIALALGVLLVLASRRGGKPLPLGGFLIAAAMIFAFWRLEVDLSGELPALGALLLGVLAARIFRATDLVTALAATPGAVWLAISSEVTDLGWVRVLIALTIPIAGYLIADFESRYSPMGLGMLFYTFAVIGVFLAIPDTEWALTLLAVTLPITFLAWPYPGMRLGRGGSYVAVAFFVLVIAQGGGPRPASIVGALACLGLMLIEPVMIEIHPAVVKLTSWPSRDWKGAIVASIPQVVVVAACSRIAARLTNAIPALLIVLLIYGATVAVAISASRTQPSRRPV